MKLFKEMWGIQNKADFWAKVSLKTRENKVDGPASGELINNSTGEDSMTAFKVGFTGFRFFNHSDKNLDSFLFKTSAECLRFNDARFG